MSPVATLVPDPKDTELAVSALQVLSALDTELPVLHVSGRDVAIPHSVLVALTQVLDSFAHGEGVTVIRVHAELTTQQAAEVLNVSRPFLIRLLEDGQIEYRTVGTHRRVSAASLMRYMREDDARRKEAADALTAEARELGLT